VVFPRSKPEFVSLNSIFITWRRREYQCWRKTAASKYF